MKAFEIDFIRQAIYQTLLQEHLINPTEYIGGVNELALTSFYEHLLSNEEIDRYVETVRDLNDQQNRTGLIANGTILSPSNPTITNLNQATIIPMDFTVNFRCQLLNRDLVKNSLDNMVSKLKGRKVDIAEFDSGKLFIVGTIANNSIGVPLLKNGDYIGECANTNLDTYIKSTKVVELIAKGISIEHYYNGVFDDGTYYYYKDTTDNKLKVAYCIDNVFNTVNEVSGEYENVIFPPDHNSFTKWTLSISFESSRCSEPRTLNAEDYCDISFGGSATLTSYGVLLGNELTKLGIKRYKVVTSDNGNDDISYSDEYTWLEPLELPSGNNAETQMNQLISNGFVNNSHTDSITLSNQYTFVLDKSITLLKELFKYGRYGKKTYTSPNMIYAIRELWSSWGEIEINGEVGILENYDIYGKIVESIDIENTESDTLTITLPIQLQGANN